MRLWEHVYSKSREKSASVEAEFIQRHNEIRDLNRHYVFNYNLLQAKSLSEALAKLLMHSLTSTVGVSGSDRGLNSTI